MIVCTSLALAVVAFKVSGIFRPEKLVYHKLTLNKECSQIFFLDQIVDESSVPSSTFKPLDQQKTDNKKYNGNGFIPDYDGYIS